MAESKHFFPGKVNIPDPAHIDGDGTGVPVISLDGNNGDVFIGGPPGGFGHRGRLVVTNKDGQETFSVDGQSGTVSQSGDIILKDNNGNEIIRLSGKSGKITLKDANGNILIELDSTASFQAGGGGQDGDLFLRDGNGNTIIHLDAGNGNAFLGGNNQNGDLFVRNAANQNTIQLDGNAGDIILGGGGTDGSVFVKNAAGQNTIQLDGNVGDVTLGGGGTDGSLFVRNAANQNTVQLDGNGGDITLGGGGLGGNLFVTNSASQNTIHLDGSIGDVTLGGNGQDGDLFVLDANGNERIHLDGETGDIRLSGADCAEDFDTLETAEFESGTVMALNQDGKLQQSSKPYDNKVVGVISGAGSYRPGIILDQQKNSPTSRRPIALMGKVYCKVDAEYASIEVGDLLTTSSTPGHAMKVSDPSLALGAVIGKALRPLHAGKGSIPVLVALQ